MSISRYPNGPARNPTSVQRGSVQFLSKYPGDPSTPGYPAYPNATRITEDLNVPAIPSLPISWSNAKKLLLIIDPQLKFLLDGTRSTQSVRLRNSVDTKVTPIWNTMAVIPGHVRDEIVILGNHRDAWVMGAADPTSGTSAMVEIVKGYGKLMKQGWRPLRTVVFASWDAEEVTLFQLLFWFVTRLTKTLRNAAWAGRLYRIRRRLCRLHPKSCRGLF